MKLCCVLLLLSTIALAQDEAPPQLGFGDIISKILRSSNRAPTPQGGMEVEIEFVDGHEPKITQHPVQPNKSAPGLFGKMFERMHRFQKRMQQRMKRMNQMMSQDNISHNSPIGRFLQHRAHRHMKKEHRCRSLLSPQVSNTKAS
jgi:hypothetical protein